MYMQLKFGKKIAASGKSAPAAGPIPEAPRPAPAAAPNLLQPVPQKQVPRAMPPRSAPQIKTYLAESVPHAMSQARREMGEDAILIQTKRNETAEVSKRFEVTFGMVPGSGPSPQPVPAPTASEKTQGEKPQLERIHAEPPLERPRMERAQDRPQGERPTIVRQPSPEPVADPGADSDIARQLGSLRREVAALQTMLRQSPYVKQPCAPDNVPASEAYAVLLGNDVDEDLALELVSGIDPDEDSARAALGDQLARQIRTDSSLGEDGKAVVLMGPPGAGKTTALIKLAVEYGLKRGNAIEVFCMSKGKGTMDRTLESMTAILGVPCEALPNAAALRAALARPRVEGTVVLVDTNGYGTSASEEEMELAEVLAPGNQADVHLVLPSAWHRVSIRQIVDRFEIFQPARLLFTMVDQAAVYGPLIQEAWRTQKPLSFISSGKVGGTALRPADLSWIVERLYRVAQDSGSGRD